VRQVLEDKPDVWAFPCGPGIGHIEPASALERIFKGSCPCGGTFLGLITQGGAGSLSAIAGRTTTCCERMMEGLGDLKWRRRSRRQLATAQQKSVAAVGKEAVVSHVREDRSSADRSCGEDNLIDASVRQQAPAMRQKLIAKMPNELVRCP